jgi:hypothetical protein
MKTLYYSNGAGDWEASENCAHKAIYDRVGIWRRLMGHTTGRQQKATEKGLNPQNRGTSSALGRHTAAGLPVTGGLTGQVS